MKSLREADPEIAGYIDAERRRQETTLTLVASENHPPPAIVDAQGSALANRYAQGYPGRRGYPGCEHVDAIERTAVRRACDLFAAGHANVQPHSGVQANTAAMMALLDPGDTVLGLDAAHGGHSSHVGRLTFADRYLEPVAYHVRRTDHLVDMAEVERLAHRHRPRLIVAGWSAYTRHLDFARFRGIADDIGAFLMVDMAHFAGLVAAGLHPSPVPYADVVTSTTHKTLGGPRGGFVLARTDLAERIDAAVSPGQQGGPLPHVIAAKAVAFKTAATPQFADVQRRTVDGARALAARLTALTGGTDVHQVLVDVRPFDLDATQAQQRLSEIGITANGRVLPYGIPGLRLGTAALATRGFTRADFDGLAEIVDGALAPESPTSALRDRVAELAERRNPCVRSSGWSSSC